MTLMRWRIAIMAPPATLGRASAHYPCLYGQTPRLASAAERLTVSRNTVKSHMAHIYAKCGVHTRAELNELLDGGECH